MIFTDLIFIFAFLPAVTLFQILDLSSEYKNFTLIIASVIFMIWGRPVWILLIFLTTITDWLFGLVASKNKGKARGRLCVVASCIIDLSVLFVFGYSELAKPLLNAVGISFGHFILPVGLGFYCLRGIAYVTDCYQGRFSAERNYFYILTYMTAFHIMPAGPLVRYDDVSEQLRRGHRLTSANLSDGITRFIIGLAKVVLIAKPLGVGAQNGILSATPLGSWLGLAVFAIAFGFLFVGYTDMALGLGLMGGIKYPENFSRLTLSGGVRGIATSFNRTVSGFFTNVAVSPSRTKSKLLGGLAVFVSSVLVGVWFGANNGGSALLMFVATGVYFGVFLMLEELYLNKAFDHAIPLLVQAYTLVVCFLGVAPFACGYVGIDFFEWARGAFGMSNGGDVSAFLSSLFEYAIVLAFAIFAMSPLKDKLKGKIYSLAIENKNGYAIVRVSQTVLLAILLIASTARLAV